MDEVGPLWTVISHDYDFVFDPSFGKTVNVKAKYTFYLKTKTKLGNISHTEELPCLREALAVRKRRTSEGDRWSREGSG